MSISSLTALALRRDGADQGEPVEDPPNPFTASIPTEPLAAYTTLIGVVLATGVTGYATFRWGALGVFVAASAAFALISYYLKSKAANANAAPRTRRDRIHFPLAEVTAAVLAATAWGLVMPGSPLYTTALSAQALTFTVASITGGAGLALVALVQVLKVGNSVVTSEAGAARAGDVPGAGATPSTAEPAGPGRHLSPVDGAATPSPTN